MQSLEAMINMLTPPYDPRTYYYFLLGAGAFREDRFAKHVADRVHAGQRVDLMREGYTITKEHRFHVRPSRHFTKQEVVQQLRDMGLDGHLKLHFNPPYVE
jgi:hypothetical protein